MKIVAVFLAVMAAAAINGFLLMVLLVGFGSIGNFVFGWLLMATAGAIVSAPGWVLGSVFVLPVITHRVRRHGLIVAHVYWTSAAVIGAFAMTPTILLIGTTSTPFVALLLVSGSIGGLLIAATYKQLVLDSLAADRDAFTGAYCG